MAFNITNIVLPGQFNAKTDVWCDYKEQLLCALDAAGLVEQDDAKSRSLFLSQCSKDTYALISSLLVPLRPTQVNFRDILSVLDKFYEPEVNEILQAGKFHRRVQLQDESVQDFVAAISTLSAKCKFADIKRQLRDRLVLGVRDDRLRRELLKTKDLKYETAVQMCLNHQSSSEDMYPNPSNVTSPTSCHTPEPMDIGRIKSNECRRCTRVHRPGEVCSFARAKCFKCQKYGHIAKACDKKSKLYQVEEQQDSSDGAEDMMGVYVCSDSDRPPISADVVINGAHVTMEVDSGASRSIISEKMFKKLWLTSPPLQNTAVKLVTWTRDSLKVLGLANVFVSLGAKEAQCELLVVSGDGPSLLGRNWFMPLDIQVTGLYWAEEDLVPFRNEFPDLFKEELGSYKGSEVTRHLRPEATPRFQKARVVPYPAKLQVETACYDNTIKHRPGKSIGNADALSRGAAPTGTVAVEPLREVLLLGEQPTGWKLTAEEIAEETKKDPLLQKVLFHVQCGWPNKVLDPDLRPFWTRREALSHNKDCLLWSNRVIVPTKLQERVLKMLHARHAGIVQTKAYARGYVWWVRMDNQIEQIVASCEQCQMGRNCTPRDPQTWVKSEKPWNQVHIDFAGPFQGKTFLVLIDSHSKWVEAEIINSMSSGAVITLLRRIFASQGLPEVLVSDNSRAFTSEEFGNFLRKNGIKHVLSPPCHPATNRQIEETIQTFKYKIMKMDVDLPWSEKLSKVLYYMRTVPNSGTNKTPAEMLNGRRYRTAISSLHPDSTPRRGEQQLEVEKNGGEPL